MAAGSLSRFGPRVIFDEANTALSSEQKTGFIGQNGAGKSTLCTIIIGQESVDTGEIIRSADLRLSYLEQHDPFTPTETVLGDNGEGKTALLRTLAGDLPPKSGSFLFKGYDLKKPASVLSGGECATKTHSSSLRRSEERQAAYRTEQAALEHKMAAHPDAWTRELAHRCDELTRLITEEARCWVQLTEQLESLSAAPGR